jgi:hypothetical protein
MEQVEMNNMYINIDVNNSSEKCREKTLRLCQRYLALEHESIVQKLYVRDLYQVSIREELID